MFQTTSPAKQNKGWIDWLMGCIIFSLVLAVYYATLTPSLSYLSPDGNEMATIPYILGLAHMTGYPLYTWLGKAFTTLPIGDVAHRMNLMSAVLGSGGVVLLYLIARELTRDLHLIQQWISRLASLFSALLFAFSLTFWSQTGIAEVYAPNVFMFALTLYLILRWAKVKESGKKNSAYWLWGFGLCFGLSLGTHMSNLGFAPGFALFILLIDWRFITRPKELFGAATAFMLGALQFLWLPYKASTLNDAPMLRNAPNTLKGIYSYTLGAFPQLKFAYPVSALPERIVLYEYLLKQQYFIPGIAIGFHGMTEMLFRKPKRFYLLISMYLVQVFFFIQYRAFDLDVFFIPSHFIFAIFIGFSACCLFGYVWALIDKYQGLKKAMLIVTFFPIIAAMLIMPIGKEIKSNWEKNDHSEDVAINDFYEIVWKILPEDSVLLGNSGVFGYDMFYYRLVYNVRPDVSIPLLDTPKPNPGGINSSAMYSTVNFNSGQKRFGPGSSPPNLVDSDSWFIPVLIGQSSQVSIGRGRDLILYQVDKDPPDLIVSNADPEYKSDFEYQGWKLIGFDLSSRSVQSGSYLEITYYWQPNIIQISKTQLPSISTALGEISLESHILGFGNLPRLIQEYKPDRNGIVKENYAIVIPSTASSGSSPLTISLQTGFNPGSNSNKDHSEHVLTQIQLFSEGEQY